MAKHIFVTGGVVSSLGKGLTSASIGMLLEKRGLSVRMQKLDPYINVDPGTMSPYQHGEVYVLDDGSETDLDLGHYERFTNGPAHPRFELHHRPDLSVGDQQGTARRVSGQDRAGHSAHHQRNQERDRQAGRRTSGDERVDVVITEIGGTVGDIESLPFLEAIRQFALDVGKQNCLYIHLTLVPYLKAASELKTKPTQHSVGQLREIGIQPDILVCRTEHSLSREDREKIALFCNMSIDAVIEEKDKDFSIYEVPLSLLDNKIDKLIVDRLGLKTPEPDLQDWRDLLQRLRNPEHEISIAIVGKYAEHRDAYKSIYEALDHAGIAHRAQVRVGRIRSEDVEAEGPERLLSGYDGMLVPGGFGERGIEGKVAAIRYARTKGIPFFGICLGMQCAVIEFARDVCNLAGAHSTEFDKDAQHPVICLLDEQKTITDKGGTMRLGAQPTRLEPGTLAAECYGKTEISERHRHRYEFNNVYRQQFTAHGMKFSGTSPDGSLVEVVELPEHPWFLAVQYHPEFKSKPTAPQPLFADFVGAAVAHSHGKAGRTAAVSREQSTPPSQRVPLR